MSILSSEKKSSTTLKLIEHYERQRRTVRGLWGEAIGKALGVNPRTVNNWRYSGVPARYEEVLTKWLTYNKKITL